MLVGERAGQRRSLTLAGLQWITAAVAHHAARRERGATAIEYALLATLIAVVIVVAATAFGLATSSLFQSAVDRWP